MGVILAGQRGHARSLRLPQSFASHAEDVSFQRTLPAGDVRTTTDALGKLDCIARERAGRVAQWGRDAVGPGMPGVGGRRGHPTHRYGGHRRRA